MLLNLECTVNSTERNRNTIAIMAAILLLPRLKELLAQERTVRHNSPRWQYAVAEAVSIAEEIYEKVVKR
jgi:hypothetical protein